MRELLFRVHFPYSPVLLLVNPLGVGHLVLHCLGLHFRCSFVAEMRFCVWASSTALRLRELTNVAGTGSAFSSRIDDQPRRIVNRLPLTVG